MNNNTNNSRIPKLRFPGFTGEWEEKKLGEIGDTFSGLSGKTKEDFEKGNSKFITFMNVLNNVRINTDILGIVNVKDGERQNKVEFGDMLFNTSSETPEEVGFCSVYDSKNEQNVYLNSFCFGYRFKNLLEYHPLFLAYFSRSNYGRELMCKLAQGITRYNLTKEYFNKAVVSFPSISEQQKISSCLSELDNLISAQGQKVDALKEKKKGLMQQLFPRQGETVPRLRFPGFPGEWEEKKMNDVFSRITRKNTENNQNVLTISAQYGLISQLDFFKKAVAAADVTGYYLLQKGDFAYNKSSSQGKPVGAIKPLKLYDKGVVSTLYICFKCNDSREIDFWEQYFDAGILDNEILSIAQEGARNHGLLNIPTSGFFELSVISPTLAEKQKIAECLSALDETITAESDKLEALKNHKKGLMQQLFPQPAK